MADYLYFSSYETARQTALGDPLQEGRVEITGTSGQSAAIVGANRARRTVRIWADVDCFVAYGSNPTATTDGASGKPVGLNNPEYFDVEAGFLLATIAKV